MKVNFEVVIDKLSTYRERYPEIIDEFMQAIQIGAFAIPLRDEDWKSVANVFIVGIM